MKKPSDQKIITKQVSRKLEDLRPLVSKASGVTSWIDYIRSGLGMTLNQLATRLKITQPSLSGLIKQEKEGRITINKLTEIAQAMDCELVYGFVPRQKIEDIILKQAINKTSKLMAEAEIHMELEDQKVLLDKDERLKELVQEKIFSKYLWDKE
jgi:predicted DNA-binding mobile mystery protein A